MDPKADQEVIMDVKLGKFRFTGERYVAEYAMPNFYFHLSTAYCIVRHLGVPVGVMDYLNDVFEKVE